MLGLILDNCAAAFTDIVGIESLSIFVKVVILIRIGLDYSLCRLRECSLNDQEKSSTEGKYQCLVSKSM